MINENNRLDVAFAVLDVLGQAGTHADRLDVAMSSISGLLLTGASDAVREAIESFGLRCNAILGRNSSTTSESSQKPEEAEASELVLHLKQVCELIRDAETERILVRLRHHGGVLPEAEVVEARRHRGWIIPRLLQECRDAIEELSQLQDREGRLPDDQRSSIPFFSLFLFSEWHVAESVPVILEGLRLGGEGPFELFGDGVHEQVPRYLAQFLPGDLERIDEVISDPGLNLYVRWAAASSYKYLVRDQVVSIDDAVARLDRLFHNTKVVGDDGRPDGEHCYELSAGILDVIDSIGGASISTIFSDEQNWDFVDRFIFDPEDAGARAAKADGSEVPDQLLRLSPTRIEDCLKLLCRWAAFIPRDKSAQRPVPQRTVPRPPPAAKPRREE